MTHAHQEPPLQRTPLYQFHIERGARLVPFAGYELPVQYPGGIMQEHLHTRSAAGLFDVSHMGQIALRPHSGQLEDAARALETLVPVDILGLPEGRQRYAFFTNESGGILDDLMVANRGDHLLLIVNASRKAADEAHLRQHLSGTCMIEALADRALLALQGPRAQEALARFTPEIASMRFMDIRTVSVSDCSCEISRSGYTGEDGFEISIPAVNVDALARGLVEDASVAPIGLGRPRQPPAGSGVVSVRFGSRPEHDANHGRARLGDPEGPSRRRSARGRLSGSRRRVGSTCARRSPSSRRSSSRKTAPRSAAAPNYLPTRTAQQRLVASHRVVSGRASRPRSPWDTWRLIGHPRGRDYSPTYAANGSPCASAIFRLSRITTNVTDIRTRD